LATVLVMSAAAFPAHIVNRIIARINSEIITQRQYDRKLAELQAELSQQYSGAELQSQLQQQKANMLRNLIDEDLMVEKAKDLDINVETDVVKQLDQIRQNNHLATLQDLEKEVEKQGLVWEDFQDQIRRQILMQKVIEREVSSRIALSREDARKYFQTHQQQFSSPPGVRLAVIEVSNDKHKPEEVQKLAQQALADLKNGTRWEEAVKKYSDDTAAGSNGELGFFKEGTLNSAVANAIAKLDVNEYTGIVETKAGDAIYKVEERRSGGVPNFEEVEQRVDETMYNQQMQGALREYLLTLRKESYIYVAPGFVDSGGAQPSGEQVDTTTE
jgi:peptidyl-prolyl cis-trans isomerase SurA